MRSIRIEWGKLVIELPGEILILLLKAFLMIYNI